LVWIGVRFAGFWDGRIMGARLGGIAVSWAAVLRGPDGTAAISMPPTSFTWCHSSTPGGDGDPAAKPAGEISVSANSPASLTRPAKVPVRFRRGKLRSNTNIYTTNLDPGLCWNIAR
jgi:hypothetical protein